MAELRTLMVVVALTRFSTVLSSGEQQSTKLANIHLLFVPEKAMNTLKSLGMEDPNQWKGLLKNNATTHWEALYLQGGKAHSFEVRINSKNVNKSQIEYRQFQLGDTEKGLELKLKDIPVNLEKEGDKHEDDVVEFFKDCSQFVQTLDMNTSPGVLESKRVLSAHKEDDSEPFLIPYDPKLLSKRNTTVTRYVPYREDGMLRISRLKQTKRGEMPGKDLSKQGCIKINMTSLVRALDEVQNPNQLKLPNGENVKKTVEEFTSLVNLLGLKIPNDTESTNKTLVEKMLLSNANNQASGPTEGRLPKPMRHLRTNFRQNSERLLQQITKNAPKQNSDVQRIEASSVNSGSGSSVMKAFLSGNRRQTTNTTKSNKNEVKITVSPTKSIVPLNPAKQKETNALKFNLMKVLRDQGEGIASHHHRHHHHHHHRRHHRNRFRKLPLVLSDDEQSEEEDFPTVKNAGSSMGHYITDDDFETPQLGNSNFNGHVTPGFLRRHRHDNGLYSLEDLQQGKAGAAGYERLQDHNEGQSPSDGIGLKLEPDSYSPHFTYSGPSSNGLYSPNLGIPDLKPYLHNEFDKENKEADELTNRYSDADIVEANRLSRFEEDKIMRHAFGLPQEGQTTVGTRQQDFPMITGNGAQATQNEDEAEMASERFPQGEARMATVQNQPSPSMLNEAGSETSLAWNNAHPNPSMIYRNEPSMINSEAFNLMNQGSRSFEDKQFPAMMSMYEGSRSVNGPLQMSNANEEMMMERAMARQRLEAPGWTNGMAMPLEAPQYPYGRNALGASPYAIEPQGASFNGFASPELPQANPFSPFQMGRGGQLTQATPFAYAAKKKKKKRSKTLHPRSSLHKKGNTTTANRKKLN